MPAFSREVHRAVRPLFLALIGAQCLHSLEEYFTKLYAVFTPAAYVSGLLTTDLRLGFAGFNAALVGFGLWCYVFRVRRNHPRAARWTWFWVLLELGNGVGHLALAVIRGPYFPGVATAPLLIALAGILAYQLTRTRSPGMAPQ
jgi:hypothetical protein